jgi:photosystem II stability/assembly factor-like uncharacterized protein
VRGAGLDGEMPNFLNHRRGGWCAVVALLLAVFAAPMAQAATGIRALDTPAIAVKAPGQVALIAITRAGNRLVAVGEHGVITFSDDNGASWVQAAVPVDVTLTSVAFATPKIGWAAGHYGVILHTEDGGLTWQEQLNGIQANQLTLEAAKAAVAGGDQSPTVALAMKRANYFVTAGPDKPFLSILVSSPQDVMVFGAYRMAMKTTDGGKTWTDWSLNIGDTHSHNLYDVAGGGNDIFIAGETGLVFHSTDGGQSFPEVTAPTDATLFTVLQTKDGGVFVCGVAGNAFRSSDAGQSWQPVNLGTVSNLTGGRVLPSGAVVVVSEAGNLFISTDNAHSFTALPQVEPMSLYDVTQAANGDLIAIGSLGTAVIPAADLQKSSKGA